MFKIKKEPFWIHYPHWGKILEFCHVTDPSFYLRKHRLIYFCVPNSLWYVHNFKAKNISKDGWRGQILHFLVEQRLPLTPPCNCVISFVVNESSCTHQRIEPWKPTKASWKYFSFANIIIAERKKWFLPFFKICYHQRHLHVNRILVSWEIICSYCWYLIFTILSLWPPTHSCSRSPQLQLSYFNVNSKQLFLWRKKQQEGGYP